MTGVLLEVVKAAPAGVRAWHPQGMADVSGFIALGCSEILIHTSDITQAFNAAFDPPDDLCERVARRLFAWAPGNVDGWPALRWEMDELRFQVMSDLGRIGAGTVRPLLSGAGPFRRRARKPGPTACQPRLCHCGITTSPL